MWIRVPFVFLPSDESDLRDTGHLCCAYRENAVLLRVERRP